MDGVLKEPNLTCYMDMRVPFPNVETCSQHTGENLYQMLCTHLTSQQGGIRVSLENVIPPCSYARRNSYVNHLGELRMNYDSRSYSQ
jgi:hypothetical protein